MIISHKYKYIYLKSSKTAGTSIEIALAKHCGEEDIVTPLDSYSKAFDYVTHNYHARNYRKKGYYHHITPDKIKRIIGPDIWNSYFKFTIVRNPWDLQVSSLWWRLKAKPKEDFSYYVNKIRHNMTEWHNYVAYYKLILKKIARKDYIYLGGKHIPILDNTRYYFDRLGKPICDYYIRYESLEEGYREVCRKVGIPYEKLPLTKNKIRPHSKHYSQYYDEETKRIIAEYFKKEIECFGYSFETV